MWTERVPRFPPKARGNPLRAWENEAGEYWELELELKYNTIVLYQGVRYVNGNWSPEQWLEFGYPTRDGALAAFAALTTDFCPEAIRLMDQL